MKKLFILTLLINTVLVNAQYSKRTITSGTLNGAWEIVYGPNDSLWITEAKGYRITRWSTGTTPSSTVLLNLTAAKADWTATGAPTNLPAGTGPQGGLMGLAIHPALYSSNAATRQAKPWVYIAYVYAKAIPHNSCSNPGATCVFSTRISRFEYKNDQLINEVIILDNMPGSSDHNSGRLVISPVVETDGGGLNDQYRLYYTIGDMGAGQLTNTSRTNNAQNQNVLEGKILRLNTESDGDGGADQWVPDDNPIYDASSITPQDYVFSMGHRNPQGLVWGSINGNRRLFSSEQLDRADDEINVIVAGKNYGWDKVSGKCDHDVDGFKIGGQTIVNEVTNCTGTEPPIFTLFKNNATYTSTYPGNGTAASTWPTIAASSIAYYGSSLIPNWYGSLLVTPLKENKIYRLKLSADGSSVVSYTTEFTDIGATRLRKITVAPNGLKFYIARDGDNSIIEYTYTGPINSTLPIKLVSFKAALVNNNTIVQWQTAQEMNTSEFIVERSLDGASYAPIGTVAASGNSNIQLDYSYTDHDAINQPASVLYYRLKSVDKDGEVTYSNIATVSLVSAGSRIVISPNPVINDARVVISTAIEGKAEWRLMDNAGRVVLQGNASLMAGNNQVNINTRNMTSGIYYFRLIGAGMDKQVKLMVSNGQ